MTLSIDDLPSDRQLDARARREIRGGFFGFLAGLYAPTPGHIVPPVNYFIDYDQTIVQQNPVNLNVIAGDGGVNSIGSISIMPVSAGSPMTVLTGGAKP